MSAQQLLSGLAGRGWSIAVAESLTGGLVTSAIVDVPGASAFLRGGIVAYDTCMKHTLLGVDVDLLRTRGAVDVEVARQMAVGVRERFTADDGPAHVGIATTGVAGPDPQDGRAVGTVFIVVVTPEKTRVREMALSGDRAQIRQAATASALGLALDAIR